MQDRKMDREGFRSDLYLLQNCLSSILRNAESTTLESSERDDAVKTWLRSWNKLQFKGRSTKTWEFIAKESYVVGLRAFESSSVFTLLREDYGGLNQLLIWMHPSVLPFLRVKEKHKIKERTSKTFILFGFDFHPNWSGCEWQYAPSQGPSSS